MLPVLTPQEKKQVTIDWNKIPIHYPRDRSIPELFEEIAGKYSNQCALRFKGRSMSYQELNEKGNQFGRRLRDLGVKKQDFVGVYLERSDDLVVVILAILKIG